MLGLLLPDDLAGPRAGLDRLGRVGGRAAHLDPFHVEPEPRRSGMERHVDKLLQRRQQLAVGELARGTQFVERVFPRLEVVHITAVGGMRDDDVVVGSPVNIALRGVTPQTDGVTERSDRVVGIFGGPGLGRAAAVGDDLVVHLFGNGNFIAAAVIRTAVGIVHGIFDRVQVIVVAACQRKGSAHRKQQEQFQYFHNSDSLLRSGRRAGMPRSRSVLKNSRNS